MTDDQLPLPSSTDIAATVTDAIAAVSDFSEHLHEFDGEAFIALRSTARIVLAATPDSDMLDTVGNLLLTMFIAGREHHAAGHASPVERNSGADAQLFVPTDWL